MKEIIRNITVRYRSPRNFFKIVHHIQFFSNFFSKFSNRAIYGFSLNDREYNNSDNELSDFFF